MFLCKQVNEDEMIVLSDYRSMVFFTFFTRKFAIYLNNVSDQFNVNKMWKPAINRNVLDLIQILQTKQALRWK